MPLPPSASDTARRKALRVLYADRVVQETALQYGLRKSITWEGEPGNRAGTNRIYGEYEGGMLETTETERASYVVAATPAPAPTPIPDAPGNLNVSAYYQKLVVEFTAPTNVAVDSYTVTVSPGGFTVSGSSSPIIVTGITNGTTYSVSVTATNATGTSAAATLGSVNSSYSPTVFTTLGSTTWTAPTGITSVEYLVVGGGGGSGGGYDTGGGGGGGGGMVLSGNFSTTAGQSYTVTVGDGGAGGTSDRDVPLEVRGSSGQSSVFGDIIALGGSGGYGSRLRADISIPAGTGGAAAVNPTTATEGGTGGFSTGGGGGGGGSSGAGGNGRTPTAAAAGAGGAGTSSSLSGTTVIYGRGGNGATGGVLNTATAGASNTGQGAKGGGTGPGNETNGAKGGSGIVILRF